MASQIIALECLDAYHTKGIMNICKTSEDGVNISKDFVTITFTIGNDIKTFYVPTREFNQFKLN